MRDSGTAMLGVGVASGKGRAREAADAATSAPLIERSIERATGVVYNITGGRDMTLAEVNEVSQVVSSLADPSANVIFGAVRSSFFNPLGFFFHALFHGSSLSGANDTSRRRSFSPPHSPPLPQKNGTTEKRRQQVVDDAYEGELHVTIVATGFPPSFEDALLADGAASATSRSKRASSSAASSAAAPEAAAGGKGGRTIQAPRSWQVWG